MSRSAAEQIFQVFKLGCAARGVVLKIMPVVLKHPLGLVGTRLLFLGRRRAFGRRRAWLHWGMRWGIFHPF